MKEYIKTWTRIIKEENEYDDEFDSMSYDYFKENFKSVFPKIYGHYYSKLSEVPYKEGFTYFDKIVKPFLEKNGYKCWNFDEIYKEIKEDYQRFESFITHSGRPSTADSTVFYICDQDKASIYEDGKWYMLANYILEDVFDDRNELIQKFADFIVDNKLLDYFLRFYDPDLDDVPADLK